MSDRYWKVIVRYGHLGIGREISVARYLRTGSQENIMDACTIVEHMPGVKARAVQLIFEIDNRTYCEGKLAEGENCFLKKLMSFRQKKAHKKHRAA